MQALDELSGKIEALLKKHAVAEAENKRLRAAIAVKDKELAELGRKLASMEQGMVSVNLGKTEMDSDEKDNMRRQLDLLIGEIDKILHTLND